MSSPKSPATTTTSTSPLRESTRNSVVQGIPQSHSWSSGTSSISSLRISKLESPLTSDSIPNHHYHRLPSQLARRQSSSFNHVRNNALVSNSPFKVRSGTKPSRIPTPSRTITNEDENQPEFGFKRRQSRVFQGLFKEQVVTKSPFLGNKRAHSELEVTGVPPPVPPLPNTASTRVSPSPELMQTPPGTPPPPPPTATPPRNPRIADLSGVTVSPSPKSSLASPKRLHGPRSLSASPASELGRRQRRKTVTFDERCDVLEFDQDEVSEEVIDTEDDDEDFYGAPDQSHPTELVSADDSFASYTSNDQMSTSSGSRLTENLSYDEDRLASEEEISNRTPRISRDDIRRRLMEQRTGDYEDVSDVASLHGTPEVSFDTSQDPEIHRALSDDMEADVSLPHSQSHVSPQLELSIDAPFDFNEPGVDLGEMHSALDRFMLGVEHGFGVETTVDQSMDTENATEGNLSANNTSAMDLDNSFDPLPIHTEFRQQHVVERHVQVEGVDIAEHESMVTDEERDDLITTLVSPPDDQRSSTPKQDNAIHDGSSQDISMSGTLHGDDNVLLAAAGEDFSGVNVMEHPEMNSSLSEFEATNPEVQTSTPPRSPRKDSQALAESSSSSRIQGSASLTLPPLSFDHPTSNDDVLPISWESRISDFNTSQVPRSFRDDTFLVHSSSTASNATGNSVPPPVPPKDRSTIPQRDDFVNARRREMRSERSEHGRPTTYHEGRPSQRRSLSTGDAEDLASSMPAAQKRVSLLREHELQLLDIPLEQEDGENGLSGLIDRELKIRKKPTIKDKNRMYKLRERENIVYASSDDKVSHMSHAGDVDSGKAWRTVRRPSDMNEYSRQIKEYRAQQKPGKAHGKVFVKVLGIRGINVPLPSKPTAFTCTLNNGIHFVTTPECRLAKDARIEQEFELIEHSKLEFTLTLKVRRDAHIAAQAKANAAPPPLPVSVAPAPPPPSHRSGVRGFFGVGTSPKKTHKIAVAAAVRATPEPVEDNLARYLKPDGTLARAFVSFKEIAKRCDTRLFETSFPLIGQRTDRSSSSSAVNPWTMGEIVLQIFRLPPLPGVSQDQLPQSLEECHRGLRHINWHKVTYHEGVLTQYGGDCRTWRRRLLRVIGANLVAFNDVTKKAAATIDLKKAIAVEDDDPAFAAMRSPGSVASTRSRDEFDEVYRVERSFRLIFLNNEEIMFFADNDEAKARWLEVFRALVGHIPPNPLWAELIWQRQEELTKNPTPMPSQSTSTLPVPRQPATSPR